MVTNSLSGGDATAMPSGVLTTAAASHVGMVRAENQDAYLIDHELDLLLVADGMGGHESGAEASRMAVELIRDGFRQIMASSGDGADLKDESEIATLDSQPTVNIATAVLSLMVSVNRMLFQRNQEQGRPQGGGMGTTVVGMWLRPDTASALVFHVGDSRLYRLREGHFEQLTRDHSLYQLWLDSGASGNPPGRNRLLKAIGPLPDVEPEVNSVSVEPGDRFLLCSDGLYNKISDEELRRSLIQGDGDLESVCTEWVRLCNERGGEDNITALLAGFD